MKFHDTALSGVILIEPDVFEDARGYFMELYHAQKYVEGAVQGSFVQDNFSRSIRHTLRGLHYQLANPQGKLVTVLEGSVYDVAADIRVGSPTFGQWLGLELSGENKRLLYIPPGFAHGFCVLTEHAGFLYKCTDFFSPRDERGIIWNDPTLRITWPVTTPLLSPKDQSYNTLKEMQADLPVFGNPSRS
ncbi:MAG: dTDP-4-dehydrorhamnose 3,5-epimerase [Nitrospiraceae bacterium]